MRLGDHLVTGEIGRGGMGVVYRARSPRGSEVAIKLLRVDRATPEALDRFRREERLLLALGDVQGFVPILETVSVSGGIGLVMPFVPGGTLRERLRAPLPLDEALAIGRALAETVSRAHERGIVHRDLKPENVLFAADGRPLVTDLGLAKHFLDSSPGASQSVSLTQDGVMKGTAGYMAPEQMRSARDAGPEADVFALGAILYECVTGVPAFRGENVLELIGRVETARHIPASQLKAGVPAWLDRAIEAALDPDPARRPADGAAFMATLAPPVRSARGWLGAIGLVVVLAVAVVVSLLVRPGHEKPRDPVAPVTSVSEGPIQSVTVIPLDMPPAALPRAYSGLASRSRRWRLTHVIGHPRWKHNAIVNAAAFSPSGDYLISAGGEWEARLWDARTGDDVRMLAGGNGSVQTVAFSPDGKRVALGTKAGRVTIHPVPPEAGPVLTPVTGGKPIVALAFSRDGARLFSVGQEGEIATTLIATKQTTRTGGGLGNVVSVAFSPDRATAVLVSEDGKARVQATDGAASFALPGLDERVSAVDAMPDGRFVFAVGSRLVFYDPARQEAASSHDLGSRIVALAAAPDGRHVAVARDPPLFQVLDSVTWTSFVAPLQREPLRCVAFSPDGRLVAVGSQDQTLRLVDASRGLAVAWSEDDRAGSTIAASDDGRRFATAGRDGIVRVWDQSLTAPAHKHALHQASALSIAMSPGGDLVLSSDESGLAVLAEAATGKVRWQFRSPKDVIRSVALSRDGRTALLGGGDGTLFVLDATTGDTRRTISHGSGIKCVAISLSAREALVTGQGVTLDDLETGAKREALVDSSLSGAAALSPDAAHAAFLTQEGSVIIWDTAGGTRRPFKAHGLGPACALFDPKGGLITTAWDWSVRFWNAETGEKTDEIDLRGQNDVPRSAAISSDGRTLLVATLRSVVLRFESR